MEINNMARAMIEAKVDYDKYGKITEVIVLPMEWLDTFLQAAEKGAVDSVNKYGNIFKTPSGIYSVWGADVLFAHGIDKPIAAGYSYLYPDSTKQSDGDEA